MNADTTRTAAGSTSNPPASTSEAAWRRDQFVSLLRFAEASIREDGAACWLDDEGRPDDSHPVETWITARMAHTFAIGHLLGVSGAGEFAARAIAGLRDVLADVEFGGWLAARGEGDELVGTKEAYAHAFVVLAGSSGKVAGIAGASELLTDALAVLDARFWEPERELHLDERSRDWSSTSDYRGVNANMHSVEALLAAHAATGDDLWLERAAAIGDQVVSWARSNDWRIPEHFDAAWNPLLEYNADRPRDQFKPYGATPGHGLEWARLLLQIDAEAGTPGRRTEAAAALFDRAVADGWDAEGGGGFAYTTDWAGTPVEPRRFHWVAAEGVATANVLGRVTGDARYAELEREWWAWIREHLVDAEHGSWHHELDTENRPSGLTWVGKPDVYHAAQAVILPELPLTGSFAASAQRVGQILT
ncbi:mannose/cellobiose epimerase-like protein (N-acyl-D-glucosamine 2-epimerase family) [Promicromonospora sp. AC04]|uniref:AGE family epimerase/isomerase n=1 Tax=Promicromonospora sp. AC04 TaxID=2135723 RepID=UPI000D354662|nr:AGE family epimerase/isomerase [Promicromonospora sp. AC04]PUB28058.1 mannose/cellobiose epimerase-like protein (N-acyl-D-glucosamine 2-epimerase family) [Promicromonospora sp. AC04]